mgnify:CR=1 FL=1
MFDLVNLVHTAGYVGLFLIIFAESGIFLGLFLPGDSLLFTTGFLASQGYLHIGIILPLFFLAAFLGDSVGYWIGYKIGPKIFTREKSLWFNPANVERTRIFFDKHGKKAIVIARFVPIIRTFIPVMAGVGEMKYETFLFYNIVGAAIWAVGITLLGYVFGNSIPNADHYIFPVVGLVVIVSLIPVAVEFLKARNKAKP